ncbi:sulfatase-like hydrolase/transferase [Mumia sp. zg.B21]|uniref:sulfatase-like hydrolase/transferase n=1 Tax=Mumia sp. zg.B21 TaxID=2855447 RepID=UPI001C6E3F6D|nr:sulfatase-like hydrolase/transferase [Mumia sp. zg.B21]MBW9208022.1 sulfatase-like hydrolase/transferase [Mumia sp. zg.B21]
MRFTVRRVVVAAVAATVVVGAGVVGVTAVHNPLPVSADAGKASAAAGGAVGSSAGTTVPAGTARYRPNVVAIVADDLDSSLVKYMPNVKKLQARGADFRRHFVVDSLCCSSRASFLTGMYPHNSKVFNNVPGGDPTNPVGGYAAWAKAKNDTKTFAYAITRPNAGYRTGFFGKYINRYPGTPGTAPPPGWHTFNALTANMYAMWNYTMTSVTRNRAGDRVLTNRRFGTKNSEYSTDVLRRMAVRHLQGAERQNAPFFVEIAPTGVHHRNGNPARKGDAKYPPAARDLPRTGKKAKKNPRLRHGDCGPVRCDRIDVSKHPSFNASRGTSRPRYADGRIGPSFGQTKKLNRKQVKKMRKHYRNRVRMAQSVDDLVGAVMRTVGPDTYIVFTSDNGYHLGHRRLNPGKSSAYDTDIRVPLVIAGPGVVRGPRYQVVQNIDVAPTLEQIAGIKPSAVRDGRSLMSILRNPRATGSRYAFIEHTRPPKTADDPDGEGLTGAIPSYIAVRSADTLLVRYDTQDGAEAGHTYEYYRGLSRAGAWERFNLFRPSDPVVQELQRRLEAYEDCKGAGCVALTR